MLPMQELAPSRSGDGGLISPVRIRLSWLDNLNRFFVGLLFCARRAKANVRQLDDCLAKSLIPARADNLTQTSATLAEWPDLPALRRRGQRQAHGRQDDSPRPTQLPRLP